MKLFMKDSEYDQFEDNLFALPENIDALVYDDLLFVVNQGNFEDIFNDYESYEASAETVFEGLSESELTIHNQSEFEEALMGDKYALRKMVEIEERGLYQTINKTKVEQVIEDYSLNIQPVEQNGDWGIIMPSKGDKRDIIRLLNDDHLIPEITDEKYQARSKRQVPTD